MLARALPGGHRRAAALLTAAAVTRCWRHGAANAPVDRRPLRYALVPFGFGVWLAHYGFHLLTGALTVVPVTQSAGDRPLGRPALGEPRWPGSACSRAASSRFSSASSCSARWARSACIQATSRRDASRPHAAASAPWVTLVVAAGRAGRVDPRAADGDARREPARMSAYVRRSLGCARVHPRRVRSRACRARRPPFPIVSDQLRRRLLVSVWTDPDTTDDGTAGGQFWVQLRMAAPATALPSTTRASIGVRRRSIRTAPMRTVTAAPVAGRERRTSLPPW